VPSAWRKGTCVSRLDLVQASLARSLEIARTAQSQLYLEPHGCKQARRTRCAGVRGADLSCR
jgi:hypothetical protein